MISGNYKIGAIVALGLALVSVFGHYMTGKKFWFYGELVGLAIGLLIVIIYLKDSTCACTAARVIKPKEEVAPAMTKDIKPPVVGKAGMMAPVPSGGSNTYTP